jgi:hypothetical protein
MHSYFPILQKRGPLSIKSFFDSFLSKNGFCHFMKYLTSFLVKFYTDLTVFASELRSNEERFTITFKLLLIHEK